MNSFHLTVITPDGVCFDGQAESLLVRTTEGDIEILAGHSELVAAIGIGRARIIADGKSRVASVSGGMLSVKGKEVKLVPITFEFKEEIDLERAKAARDKAEEKIKRAKNDGELKFAKTKLMRALSRINVASSK